MAVVGRGRSLVPRMDAVGAWPLRWAPSGNRGVVAGPLGPVWPLWGRGLSPGPRMAAVGARLVPWALYGRRGAWLGPWAPYGRRGGVADPLGPVWLPWERGQSPGPRMAAV